jgi:hypothetical protein
MKLIYQILLAMSMVICTSCKEEAKAKSAQEIVAEKELAQQAENDEMREKLRLEKIREKEANKKRRATYSPDDDI